MTEMSQAWVWSQYQGVVSGGSHPAAPLPLFGATGFGSANRTKRGIFVATAMIIGLLFPKIAFLLLIFSGFLILSGLEPKRFEDFFNEVPGGSIVLRILAISDAILP